MHGKQLRLQERRVPQIAPPRIYGRPKRTSIAHKETFQSARTVPHVVMRRLLKKRRARRSISLQAITEKIKLSRSL